MLHVLLIILKIAGIILAVVLGLILLILAVPIRYSFQAEKGEEEAIQGRIKVTWFFALLYVKVSYIESVFDYCVRIAGYQILGNQETFLKKQEEKQKRKNEKKKKKAEKNKTKTEVKTKTVIETKAEHTTNKPEIIKDIPEKKEQLEAQSVSDVNRNTQKKVAQEKKEKKTNFVEKIKKKISGIWKKAASLQDKAGSVRNLYEEYHGGDLLRLAKESIMKIARHILPRRLKGRIKFGFEDPATTGILTGVAAIFYPKYQKNFQLEPNFGERCFEADCKGRGRIRPGFFLVMMIQLLLNQDIRRCIKLMLK